METMQTDFDLKILLKMRMQRPKFAALLLGLLAVCSFLTDTHITSHFYVVLRKLPVKVFCHLDSSFDALLLVMSVNKKEFWYLKLSGFHLKFR